MLKSSGREDDMATQHRRIDPELGAALLMVVGCVIAGWGFGSIFGDAGDGAVGGSGLALVALGWLLARNK
jgi:uncharacterized protein (TIGR03382 family)